MALADTQHSLLTLCAGGRVGLPSRTQSALDDIQRLQPTIVIAPTSFIQALQDEFDRQLSQRQQQQQQQSSITEGGRPLLPHAQRIEMLFLREFAKTLGSRLAILAITGSLLLLTYSQWSIIRYSFYSSKRYRRTEPSQVCVQMLFACCVEGDVSGGVDASFRFASCVKTEKKQ